MMGKCREGKEGKWQGRVWKRKGREGHKDDRWRVLPSFRFEVIYIQSPSLNKLMSFSYLDYCIVLSLLFFQDLPLNAGRLSFMGLLGGSTPF